MKVRLNYIVTGLIFLIPLVHLTYHGYTCTPNPFSESCDGSHLGGMIAAYEVVILALSTLMLVVWGLLEIYEKDITFEIPINKREDKYSLTSEEAIDFAEWRKIRDKKEDPLLYDGSEKNHLMFTEN